MRADRFGLPRVAIDLRFTEGDARSVVGSHQVLDAALRANAIGRLEYWYPQKQLRDRVLAQASDGFHQVGTTRMGQDPKDSVVDADLKIHDIANLHVASSSVFPTTGQANSTLLATALAIRLANHLNMRAAAEIPNRKDTIMRRVEFAPLARSISAIGFGCASLGSRVDGKRGTAALARAYDAGVTWFDVAPSYGDGHAEVLLGKFLAGKRSQVAVCTKVGIVPGRVSLAMRIAKPVVQWAIVLRPELRKPVPSFRPPAQRVELTGPLIESSIVESLRRLQTDYIDVLALHEATLDDVQRDDVLRALDNVISKGYARAISLAGDLVVALAAVALSERFRIIQFANNLFAPNVALANQQLPPESVCGLRHT